MAFRRTAILKAVAGRPRAQCSLADIADDGPVHDGAWCVWRKLCRVPRCTAPLCHITGNTPQPQPHPIPQFALGCDQPLGHTAHLVTRWRIDTCAICRLQGFVVTMYLGLGRVGCLHAHPLCFVMCLQNLLSLRSPMIWHSTADSARDESLHGRAVQECREVVGGYLDRKCNILVYHNIFVIRSDIWIEEMCATDANTAGRIDDTERREQMTKLKVLHRLLLCAHSVCAPARPIAGTTLHRQR